MVTEGSNVEEGARRVRPLLASPPSEEEGGEGRAGAPVWERGCDGARGACGVGDGREVPSLGPLGPGPWSVPGAGSCPGGAACPAGAGAATRPVCPGVSSVSLCCGNSLEVGDAGRVSLHFLLGFLCWWYRTSRSPTARGLLRLVWLNCKAPSWSLPFPSLAECREPSSTRLCLRFPCNASMAWLGCNLLPNSSFKTLRSPMGSVSLLQLPFIVKRLLICPPSRWRGWIPDRTVSKQWLA